MGGVRLAARLYSTNFHPIMHWQGVFDVPIYGRVSNMGLFSVKGEATQRLFLLTEKYQFAVLKFDPEQGAWRRIGCLLPRTSPRQPTTCYSLFSPPSRIGEQASWSRVPAGTCRTGSVGPCRGRSCAKSAPGAM